MQGPSARPSVRPSSPHPKEPGPCQRLKKTFAKKTKKNSKDIEPGWSPGTGSTAAQELNSRPPNRLWEQKLLLRSQLLQPDPQYSWLYWTIYSSERVFI